MLGPRCTRRPHAVAPPPAHSPQAINALGQGPFSLCSAFTTQATVPAAPQPPVCATAAAVSSGAGRV